MSRWMGWLVLLGALVWAGLVFADTPPLPASLPMTANAGTQPNATRPHSPPSVARGEAVFRKVCAPCHGAGPGNDGSPMLPGTAKLQAKYQGAVPAAVEQRRDLTADALRVFVRNGVGAMPRFRKTEISDEDLEAMAAWLSAQPSAGSGSATVP